MDQLATTLRDAIAWYAGNGMGANVRFFPIFDEVRHIYAVNAIDYPTRLHEAGVVIMARIVGDKIVIEEDTTDRPLVQRLEEMGIACNQIILAYEGEPAPDLTSR